MEVVGLSRGLGRAEATDSRESVDAAESCRMFSALWLLSIFFGSSRHRSTRRVVVAWTSRNCALDTNDRRTSLIWGRLCGSFLSWVWLRRG